MWCLHIRFLFSHWLFTRLKVQFGPHISLPPPSRHILNLAPREDVSRVPRNAAVWSRTKCVSFHSGCVQEALGPRTSVFLSDVETDVWPPGLVNELAGRSMKLSATPLSTSHQRRCAPLQHSKPTPFLSFRLVFAFPTYSSLEVLPAAQVILITLKNDSILYRYPSWRQVFYSLVRSLPALMP